MEIIALMVVLPLLASLFFYAADRFSERMYICIPMIVIGAFCIAIMIVGLSAIVCHYLNTLGLNI